MLECKTYTYAEFSALFNTRDNQGIKRRLDRWGIKYSTAGRGTGLKYTIEEISDPFVPFCILDLGFPPQTIFDKLNLFLYYLLDDEEFAGLPCEMMEQRIKKRRLYPHTANHRKLPPPIRSSGLNSPSIR